MKSTLCRYVTHDSALNRKVIRTTVRSSVHAHFRVCSEDVVVLYMLAQSAKCAIPNEQPVVDLFVDVSTR